VKYQIRILTILTIFMLALFLAACAGGATPAPEQPQEEPQAEEAAPAEEEAAPAEEEAMAEPGLEGYAGLDKDLSGVTIRMANIGGQPYEAMYDSIKVFEEKTGATVEIVFLGDGFEIEVRDAVA